MAMALRRGASLTEKLKFQWKRGWNEIPEVMGGMGIAIIGFGLTIYSSYKMATQENPTRQFKYRHTIMRPDDPETQWLIRNEYSPPITRTKMPNSKFC